MSIMAHAMGKANSEIDKALGIITLRSSLFPKNGFFEWVIHEDIIVINTKKRKGIDTETIQISQINELTADLGRTSGRLDIWGNSPKLWTRGISFSAPDMFVAYAAYTYILSKRINDTINPIRHSISPTLAGMQKQLENGELDKEALRAKGVHFLEPVSSSVSVPKVSEQPAASAADEILKLKSLLDMGALTQDEFEHKKRVLLGL